MFVVIGNNCRSALRIFVVQPFMCKGATQGKHLTRWLPAYDIFVLRFRPKKQQFSVALPTP